MRGHRAPVCNNWIEEPMADIPTRTYSEAGVDTDREEIGLTRLVERLRRTFPSSPGLGEVVIKIGYFANVINLGTIGLAIAADGVGTKVLIAQMMDKYDTIGIDCVAVNVNDLLCVGARPISMVDYIALQDPDPDLLDDISKGLYEGARLAEISIPGGEIAQLREIVKGYKEGYGFDLAGMAVGTVPLDRIIIGRDLQAGDVIIGIESSGIHSNGLSLARRVLFEDNHFAITDIVAPLKHSLGEELLKPTHIYTREVAAILAEGIRVKALIHITGDGFLNLTRVEAKVSFIIDRLPPPPPIFSLIETYGRVSPAEMFRVYNMGIGFCVIVPPPDTERVLAIIQAHGKQAYPIGYITADQAQYVRITQRHLIGRGKHFSEDKV
jgi:phosphoribosylformylglycinamidine cyclo-ligase